MSNNSGGGIELTDGSPVLVETSTVSGNGGNGVKSTGQGTTSLIVSGSTISDNALAGITCGACGTVSVLASSVVSGNGLLAGPGTGGGVAVTVDQDDAADAPVITITNSTISNNTAAHSGGGVSVNWIEAQNSLTPTQTTISGSTISNNHADCVDCDGGGVSVLVGSLSISGSQISGNTANANGGGISQDRRSGDELVPPTSLTLTDSTVTGNTAGRTGGGVSDTRPRCKLFAH